MGYKFILLDIDDTVLDFKKAERAAFEKTHIDNGVAFSDKDYELYSKINADLWKALERGEISSSEVIINTRYSIYCKERGIAELGESFRVEYESNLSENAYVFDEEVFETLSLLKKHCKIYSITNGTYHVQSKRIKKSGVEVFLDGQFISEKVGYRKPDKRFFEYVESNIPNFDKAKALVVGDSLTADMPAKKYGYDTCLINRKNIEELLFEYSPTYIIKSFSDLKKFVNIEG